LFHGDRGGSLEAAVLNNIGGRGRRQLTSRTPANGWRRQMGLRDRLLALAVLLGLAVAASSASAQGVHYFAVMNGGNETAAADPDGYGTATVVITSTTSLCYAVVVHKIAVPTAMHIHEGFAGIAGPIRVNLTPPAAGNPGTSSGCVGGVSAAVISRIRGNPTSFYVNVHTGQFPAGAIRGQLF
jgi:hypothetical protein